jgi:hypothetical protein
MNKIKFLFIIFINVSLYAQADSLIFDDCSCDCIEKHQDALPNSFFIGQKYPNQPPHYFYEYFGIPETSLVKFNMYDAETKLLAQTEYCLLRQGEYKIILIELLKSAGSYKSGVYFLEMLAISPQTHQQKFRNSKKVLFVK